MVNTYCVVKCEYGLPSYYPDFAFLPVHSELKAKLSAYRNLEPHFGILSMQDAFSSS